MGHLLGRNGCIQSFASALPPNFCARPQSSLLLLQHIERLLAASGDEMGNFWEHSAFPANSFMRSPGEMIEERRTSAGVNQGALVDLGSR
jgi:hypothetical protein